ncbi:MAG: methylenetetrahydrofolate reductase [Emcibacteraceae bacterium]|nr:methylenetetrahydrofolate reductase [Emcibacteraceae bacterium]
MKNYFSGLDDAPDIRRHVASMITAEQCLKLYQGGVNNFHFYTLNRAELTYTICHILGIRPQGESA